MKEKVVYQLKVTLRGIRPPIWRRVLVRSDLTLNQLHDVLQLVMGWRNSHLHQFRVGRTYFGTPDPELPFEVHSEKRIRLNEVLRRPKARMVYEYDFGDGWEHDVVLEAVIGAEPRGRYPIVLAGKRRCPPEDVGGVGGYYGFLEAIRNPKHPEHREMKTWWGGLYNPDEFNPQEINVAFHGGWRPWRSDV